MEEHTKSQIKSDVVIFTSQVLLLFIVVVTSLVNLSLDRGNTNLWTMILTSCLGYMMPNPRLKTGAKDKTSESTTGSEDGVILRHVAIKRAEQR